MSYILPYIAKTIMWPTPLYTVSPLCCQLLYIEEDRNVISSCVCRGRSQCDYFLYIEDNHKGISSSIWRISTMQTTHLYIVGSQSFLLLEDRNVNSSSTYREIPQCNHILYIVFFCSILGKTTIWAVSLYRRRPQSCSLLYMEYVTMC